jgi:hypothetical protein
MNQIGNRKSEFRNFFSWLQAELDVQAFQIHRDRLNAKRARLDRESAANKAAARLMTGVINIQSEVVADVSPRQLNP